MLTAAIYIELLLEYINIKSVKLDLLKDPVLSVHLKRIVLYMYYDWLNYCCNVYVV